jgi:tyrosinase
MAAIKRLLAQPAILLVALLSFIGLQVNAAAVGSNAVRDDYSPVSKRQTPSFYPIVGIRNKVVERRSITVLQTQYPDIFNMLVLAWRNLQLRPENRDLSYYQVAGIHGLPHIPWQYPASATVNPDYGYCTHGSALFLTWHRPYVLLLEQLLREEAVAIARNFTGAAATRYQAAADNVRLPYWDWASKGTEARFPAVLSRTSITVTRPGAGGAATSATIPNPLYAYRFLSPQPSNFGLGATTVRSSSVGSFDFGASTRDATYRSFANARYNNYQDTAEGIHGGVHINVGEDMAVVDTAGFDPVFWLHHCQVDRLFAMYQATHPGEAVTPEPRSPTFALGGSGPDDIRTPLFPFRNGDGREWNSDQIKTAQSIFTYGYSYPEVPQGRSATDLRTFTTGRINALYGPNTATPSFQGARSGAASLPAARREWSINVLADRSDFTGSHRITFFLGSSDKPIGQAGIFRDATNKPASNKKLNITVPVTSALIDEQVSLQPEITVPALKGLRWVIERAGKNAGGVVPASNFPSLQIAVTSAIINNQPNELPAISNQLTHVTPTAGKEGGLQPNDPAPVGEKAPPNLDSPNVPSGNSTTS